MVTTVLMRGWSMWVAADAVLLELFGPGSITERCVQQDGDRTGSWSCWTRTARSSPAAQWYGSALEDCDHAAQQLALEDEMVLFRMLL